MTSGTRADRSVAGRRSVARVLGTALATGLVAGALAGVALAAAIAHLHGWSPGRDAWLLAAYLSGLYAAVFCSGLLISAAGLIAIGGRPGPRVFVALVVGACVFLTGVLRFSPAIQPFSVISSINLLGVVDLIGVGVGSLAFAGAVLSTTRIRIWGALGVGVAVFGALHVIGRWHEAPHIRDLAAEVPPLLVGATPPPPAPPEQRFSGAKLFVLGLDGLSWDVLVPLLRRGELPGFQALLARASYGYLDTLRFTVSPVVWETIVTGKPEREHGIGHHFHYVFPGLSEEVTHLPNMRLCNTPLGVRRLLAATRHIAPWHSEPASSREARAARFWEIASRSGLEVGVFGFTNTTPAAPLDGFVHGYGVHPPTDYPPNLQDGLAPLPPRPGTGPVSGLDWVDKKIPLEKALWQRFITLTLRYAPQVPMYYTHFGDGTNHVNWKREVVGDSIFFTGFGLGEFEPGDASTPVNRMLDGIVRDVLARLPEDAIFVVVSDHGFDFRGYEHDNMPPGTFIISGPGIRSGPMPRASIYDVTPTLLQLLGLPIADDMRGQVMPVAIEGGPLDRPVRHIASWGEALRIGVEGTVDPKQLGEHEEYLKALGYVVD